VGGDRGVAVLLAEYKAGRVADCPDGGAASEQEGEEQVAH